MYVGNVWNCTENRSLKYSGKKKTCHSINFFVADPSWSGIAANPHDMACECRTRENDETSVQNFDPSI
jgi:hypothetical protein